MTSERFFDLSVLLVASEEAFSREDIMIYKDFKGDLLSFLGFGAMRLPVQNGDDSCIDEKQAQDLVEYAYRNGINYFDTAWGYHAGNSESLLGQLLLPYPRKSYYLATKFPGYDIANFGRAEKIFSTQLRKCQVSYFDYYLLHNVCEMNIRQYLDPSYQTVEYLMQEREEGRIRHLGFSAHGSPAVVQQFLEKYGTDMEFCQLQLNYLDWEFQEGRKKVDLLDKWQIPVWVMEPQRGGRLSCVSESERAELEKIRPEESPASIAFRFVQGIPNVKVILSGMTKMEQLKENISIFDTDEPLTSREQEKLLLLAQKMTSDKTVPCTACHYCTSHCPQHLDIPELLKLYNEHVFTGGGFLAPMALSALPPEKQPSACIGCRSCEAVCPQMIHISECLSDFTLKIKGSS